MSSRRGVVWFGLGLILGQLNLPSVRAVASHFCFGERATIVGTNGADHLSGTPHRDVIVGLRGIDRIGGYGGDDLICLGPGGRSSHRAEGAGGYAGDDRISGGPGFDDLGGGEGTDRLHGGADPDVLFGGEKDDILIGGGARDILWGEDGDDLIRGTGGSDILRGGPGDDRIVGGRDGPGGDLSEYWRAKVGVVVNLARGSAKGEGTDKLVGIEHIIGSDKNDTLIGDDQANVINGISGSDTLRGMGGDDCLSPGNETNRAYGGTGTDYYSGESLLYLRYFNCSLDSAFGGSTSSGVTVDLAKGTATRNFESTTLYGIEGVVGGYYRDHIMGNEGPNYLYGGPSKDMIEGRAGDDTLDGAGDTDILDGGDGGDDCLNGEVVTTCE